MYSRESRRWCPGGRAAAQSDVAVGERATPFNLKVTQVEGPRTLLPAGDTLPL